MEADSGPSPRPPRPFLPPFNFLFKPCGAVAGVFFYVLFFLIFLLKDAFCSLKKYLLDENVFLY